MMARVSKRIPPLLCTAWLLLGLSHDANARPRTLLIAVDAIPFGVVLKLTDPGLGDNALFKGMKGPAAVINSFPTGSYIAWTGLLQPLGSAKALGYEACHFNRSEARLRGCFSLITVPAPWKEVFDWYLKGVARKAIAYGWPKKYSVSEMERGFTAFLDSDKEFFSMYIVSTDGLGHVKGPEALADFLKTLDRALEAVRRDNPNRPFRTVIVSDHGMAGDEPLRNTWPKIKESMKKAGFHLSNTLKKQSDVTFVKYGLLSSFVVYTWDGLETKIASLLASVPGVDLCVVSHPRGWRVVSNRGDALIAKKSGITEALWSYEMLTGDPLDYGSIVKEFAKRSDDKDWFPDSWWFAATKHNFYPDGLYRLAESFALVENPASIICSNSPGYMFGSRFTEYVARLTIGRLKWTHGALYREASLGFLMTDVPGWPVADAVRFDQALAPIARLKERRR